MPLNTLNKAQQEAVEYTDGPLLIVAGAGTGKTTVITQKIVHLIERGLAKPEEILALTFTDKAAQEMQVRVDTLLDVGYVDLSISTFHAFCQRLLEEYGLDIGLPNRFKLFTQTESWLLLRQHLYDLNLEYYRPMGNPSHHIHELIKHFSKCKDELISPKEYMAYAEHVQLESDDVHSEEKNRLAEIAHAYHTYNQLLLEAGALDFGDLIAYSVKLLEERKNILSLLQKRFRFILVDEFQDVNWAQYTLVKLLAQKSQLTVVGDDDQSIYAFRGASVSNILRFTDDYPQAKKIVLNQNYRSDQSILDLAYISIQKNNPDRLEEKLGVNKKLESQLPGSGDVRVEHIHCRTHEEEVRMVIKKICELREQPSVTWSDMAILVRANSHAAPFIAACESRGIPYEFLSSSGLFRQGIVMDCINFFKIIDNIHESTALYRLLRMPIFSLSENDMQKLLGMAKKKSVTYYEALKRSSEFHLSPEGIAITDKLLSLIHQGMKRARFEKLTMVLYEFLEGSGYLEHLAHAEGQGSRSAARSIYHVKQFFDFLETYQQATPDSHVKGFLAYYEQMNSAGDDGKLFEPTDVPDALNIMTIHGSKGLEFSYVFVVDMVEDRFPARARSDGIELPLDLIKEQLPEGEFHIEEERRLLYVAMTRAKQGLFVTSADDYGGARKKKLSRFLTELGFDTKKTAPVATHWQTGISDTRVNDIEERERAYQLPKTFSFSQIRSYETCPYQYKLAHVLKIPMKGSASFSFGNTMHLTLQRFYEQVQLLNRAKQESLFHIPSAQGVTNAEIKVPSLDELLALYEHAWIPDWYEHARQREDYYKKGKEILKTFYAAQSGAWTIPVSVEGWFKIKVGAYVINGKIDRVDQCEDGTLHIIDYKTGKSKQTLGGDDKDQLLIYQIAAQSVPEYAHIGSPSKLTFYYLNDNIQTSFLGKDKELEKLKEKVAKTLDGIHQRDFTATPSKHICARCDFRDICEYRI